MFPFASFLFCYSSIIFVVRRQAKIVASRVGNPFAGASQQHARHAVADECRQDDDNHLSSVRHLLVTE
jgi:hypothetical protein